MRTGPLRGRRLGVVVKSEPLHKLCSKRRMHGFQKLETLRLAFTSNR
jgi:hypothetical protein